MKVSAILIVSLVGIGVSMFPVDATPLTEVPAHQAQQHSTPVQITPGRATRISFRNSEVITFILLSDSRQITFTTDAPLDSGRAKTLILRQIQPLAFPGATQARIPNLLVTTVNAQGEQFEYEFHLHPSASHASGVAITATEASFEGNTWETPLGTATLHDIQRGLEVAIASSYTHRQDPIVRAILTCLVLARNGTALRDAAQIAKVPILILDKLAELGIEEATRRRFNRE